MKKQPPPPFRLPRFTARVLPHALSETIDWGLQLLNVPPLWKQTRGEGILVAILDTGATPQHPDLSEAYREIKDFTRSGSGPYDQQGHGAHCTGIVAARQNNTGVVGVAPLAKILAGKVLGDNGSGSHHQIAAGIHWAVESRAQVISMSLGSSQPSMELERAVEAALKRGVIVVAAAGNEGPFLDTVGYPAKYEGVISVGSIDRQRNISRYSSRGRRVDVVAPGQDITSCWPPSGLSCISGTSMACPFVAGLIALLLAKPHKGTPATTPKEILEHIHRTSIDLGDPGFDTSSGYGLINPAKLLGEAESTGSGWGLPQIMSWLWKVLKEQASSELEGLIEELVKWLLRSKPKSEAEAEAAVEEFRRVRQI